jgi:hypothetical protein
LTIRLFPRFPAFLATLAVAVSLIARPLVAQRVVVRVATPEGAPIADATVDFWQKTRRVLSLRTRKDGQATVERRQVSALSSVSARAIGFRTASVPASGKDTVEVRLATIVPRLPEIVVEAMPRYACREDERNARSVWRAAVARYALLPLERGYWASGRGARDTFMLSSAAAPDSGEATRWGVSGPARAQSVQFIRDSGYAIRLKPGRRSGIVGAADPGPWWYPKLHTWNSDHFARPEFAALNALFVVSAGPTGWTIGYCSNRPKRPGIAGQVRIDSAYRFVRAEWEFQTPKPKEDAGGEIVFLAGTRAALLPLESYFWRRIDAAPSEDGRYRRESFRGDQWTIDLGEPTRDEPQVR